MRTTEIIQSKLDEIYEKFKVETVLPQELVTRISPPLLLRVSEKWVKSEKRILVIGQETLGWNFPPHGYPAESTESIEDFSDFQNTENSVNAMTTGYRYFEFARHQRANYNSPFWRSYRQIRSAMGESEVGYETAVLWSNLFRASLGSGSVIKNGTAAETVVLREAGAALLRAEIQALAPTSVIFFTGPSYDKHLSAIFQGVELHNFFGHAPKVAAQLKHPILPNATFRTYHPGYLSRIRKMSIVSEIITQII